MIVHLLESTLLLALAILIAHLPRLAARTRYAIVFAALMKFAIPSAIVPRILALFGVDLSGMAKGTIVIEALGPLNGNAPDPAGSPWPLLVFAVWTIVAAALLIRAFILGKRAVRNALSGARDADGADLVALDRAKARAGVTRAVRLVRSSALTPSTVGILRPIIVFPFDTTLAGAELETILAHECAHIARHDNLLNIIESIAGCALWFHPLVWIARRVLDAAREEACDAIVVASGNATVYVTALGKVCGSAIAPRTAGVSCIVSNTIRERMEVIMSFGTRRLLPHRAVTAMVIAFLAVVTIGSGVARALPAQDDNSASPYKVEVNAVRVGSYFDFFISVHNRADGKVVHSSRLRTVVEKWGTAQSGRMDPDGEHTMVIRVKGHEDGTATVEIVNDGAAPVTQTIVARNAHAVKKEEAKSPDTISIDLKDADIRDVLRTFAQLTNTNIIVDDDVTGHVTVTFHDIPWTEAFDNILRQNNLRSEQTGNTIYVHRQ